MNFKILIQVHPRLYGDSLTRFTIYWTVSKFIIFSIMANQ